MKPIEFPETNCVYGKVYKSKKKFLEAATAFEEERKSKFEKHG